MCSIEWKCTLEKPNGGRRVSLSFPFYLLQRVLLCAMFFTFGSFFFNRVSRLSWWPWSWQLIFYWSGFWIFRMATIHCVWSLLWNRSLSLITPGSGHIVADWDTTLIHTVRTWEFIEYTHSRHKPLFLPSSSRGFQTRTGPHSQLSTLLLLGLDLPEPRLSCSAHFSG